jgi:hypothetical protein
MKVTVEIPDCAKPGQHGVYVCFDGEGEVLYIGRTQNLLARLRQHRITSPWFREMRSIEFTPCDGANEARTVEKSMIATFTPDANVNDRNPVVSRTHSLPSWVVGKLVALHEAGVPRERDQGLNNYLLALHEAGWTYAALGEALCMTREAVRQRCAFATGPDASRGVPAPPAPPVKISPVKPQRPVIPPAELARMRQLMAESRTVNGGTSAADPRRQAALRLAELMAEHYLRGVSMYRIAKQLGVTQPAVYSRLVRHGYIDSSGKSAAFRKYVGQPVNNVQAITCKAGHPLDGDNVRHINGDPRRRVCRTCERRRVAKYRASRLADTA